MVLSATLWLLSRRKLIYWPQGHGRNGFTVGNRETHLRAPKTFLAEHILRSKFIVPNARMWRTENGEKSAAKGKKQTSNWMAEGRGRRLGKRCWAKERRQLLAIPLHIVRLGVDGHGQESSSNVPRCSIRQGQGYFWQELFTMRICWELY